MRIDSSGNVGIGTSSPTAYAGQTNLNINSTGVSRIDFDISNSLQGFLVSESGYIGLYANTGNILRLGANNSEAMRIDSSGNVGIGTTSPSAKLTVIEDVSRSALTGTGVGQIHISGGTTPADNDVSSITFSTNNTTTSSSIIGNQITNNGSNLFFGTSSNYGSGVTNTAMFINYSGKVGIGTSSPNAPLDVQANSAYLRIKEGRVDATNNVRLEAGGTVNTYLEYRGYLGHIWDVDTTERMRINSSGNVLIGTTNNSPAESITEDGIRLGYNGGTQISANGLEVMRINRNTNDGRIIGLCGQTTVRGEIAVSGTVIQYTSYSDHRLKEDVQQISNATESLKQLNPVNFAWIDGGVRMNGFLAHEVQSVVPEAVTGTKDEVDADGNPVYQGIDQSKLVPLLVASLKEALTEIDNLKARVDTLEGN
jgi:hypothetical protein